MSLATRLNAFFLSALAVVLFGFSLSLFLLARSYLLGQVDEHAAATMNTLAAAAELDSEGVEWEPHERRFDLGSKIEDGSLCWTVRDAKGVLIDQSGLPASFNHGFMQVPIANTELPVSKVGSTGDSWRLLQRELHPAANAPPPTPNDKADPRTVRSPFLIFTVAASVEPALASLRSLGLALSGISLLIVLVAVFAGRWYCRTALLPVTQMADRAEKMQAANFEERLPSPLSTDELGKMGDAFNGLLDRLQAAFVRQQRFAGDASHQLRTPLAGMLGQIEVCLRQTRSPEEYAELLGRVLRRGRQMSDIVETLLFLARSDGGKQTETLEEIDLADWLEEHLREWDNHARRDDLTLQIAEREPCFVRAQHALLGQLVDAMLDNAMKYSPPGTAIIIGLERALGTVRLEVEDRGDGITEDERLQIFDPFYRSPGARQSGIQGVGLGLSVAARIVSLFGGTISSKSPVGQSGSCFVVNLPVAVHNPVLPRMGDGFRT